MSPVTTALDPKPMRVRNIFICSLVVFCASSRMTNESFSERPRMKASGATSMTLRSIELRDALEAHHFVRARRTSAAGTGRPFATSPRAETPAARPPRPRAHQHDAADVLRLQRFDRAGDGEIGFAGAGRTDAESQIVRADIVQILGLIVPPRADRAARRVHLQFVGRGARSQPMPESAAGIAALHAELLQRDVHAFANPQARAGHARKSSAAPPPRAWPRPAVRRSESDCRAAGFRRRGAFRSVADADRVGRTTRPAARCPMGARKTSRVSGRSSRGRFCDEPSAQRIGHGFGDDDVGEAIDEGARISAGPSKLTQRLLSVRPASCRGSRLAGRSTSTRCVLPTMRLGNGAGLRIQALLQRRSSAVA